MAPKSDTHVHGAGSPSPSPADIRMQLERILASQTLTSPRRRAFLRYLVEEALAGRVDGLKGYSIGLAVFGRGATFEPQSDPIVRLEAHRLRRDLDSYYIDAGAHDAVRITIPKGRYVPLFKRQPNPVQDDLEAEKVAELAGPAPTVDKPDGADAAGMSTGHKGVRILVGLFAVLLLLVASGVWVWFRSSSISDASQAHGPAIVVLPFDTFSSAEDDRFLAAGVTQELITGLMGFEGFRLYSAPASFQLDASTAPITIGRDLGVDYVIKGNVSSDAATVRLGAQLFDAHSGRIVWGETFDREKTANAMLGIRTQIAADIAATLGQSYGVLNSDLMARLSKNIEPSMESYACVLRGHVYRRTFRDELRKPVLACLEAAIKRDPDYAEPLALLGWLHLDAARYGFVPDAEFAREMELALSLASRAVAREPESVFALRALSAVQYHLGSFDESDRIQRQALALNPNDPDTLAQLGWRLAFRGRWEEGLGYTDQAIARTVNPPGWYYDVSTIHLYLEGRYREMLASAEHSARGDPTGSSLLAIAYGALGNRAAAQEALTVMAQQAPAYNRDPAALMHRFQLLDSTIDALMAGLRHAGWKEPGRATVADEQ